MKERIFLVFASAAMFLGLALPVVSDDMFNQADADGDGFIDTEEFRDHMIDTFYLSDFDRNGMLNDSELDVVNQERLPEADKNADNALDLREFLNSTSMDFDAQDKNDNDLLEPGEI